MPSGIMPMSSGRRFSKRLSGPSSTMTSTPSQMPAEQQPDTHRGDAKLDDKPRAALIHEPPDKWGYDRRDEKPERKRARRQTAVPAKLVEHRREQEREGGARIDPDRHRDKRNRDQD